MAWSASSWFRVFFDDQLDVVSGIDLDGDTLKAALYDNDITPDNTVAAAASAYNTGVWDNSNEVDDSTEWDAGGEPITSAGTTGSSTTTTFDGTDTPSGGSSATLANVFGVLVYSDTVTSPVADQGVCYNYLGGANSVVNGTFTVVWSGSGIAAISLS
jgi:hypothetical protein